MHTGKEAVEVDTLSLLFGHGFDRFYGIPFSCLLILEWSSCFISCSGLSVFPLELCRVN
jgi:hypothetical protein